jgi:hypothetical protein
MTQKTTKDTLSTIIAQSKKAKPTALISLIKKATALLEEEQTDPKTKTDTGRLLHITPIGTAYIIGDLHGDLASLKYILKNSGFITKAKKKKPVHLIFLGDYGDRGPYSPEVYYVILKLKTLFPDKVALLRGNHEGPKYIIPSPYDLPKQLTQKYGEKVAEKVHIELRKLFDRLFSVAIIKNKVLLVHGGPSREVESIHDLALAHKNYPRNHIIEDLLWSDPIECLEWTSPSFRGAGQIFGKNLTEKQLKLFNCKFLIRGHENCEDGYRFNHGGLVLTLFSTNKYRYCNRYAAYLKIDLEKDLDDKQLKESIVQFE